MALVQPYEMDSIVERILVAVRKKAAEFGLTEGAVAICCSDDVSFTKLKQTSCFGLLPGEDCMRVFPIKQDGSFAVRNEHFEEEADCFGVVAMKVAAAREAYDRDFHSPLTSRESSSISNITGRQNWGGCVNYPLKINGRLCGFIFVAVSGGTERQDELCAWEAYEPISRGLVACCTSNPGRIAYEEKS